jgi:dihydropteroate synthase
MQARRWQLRDRTLEFPPSLAAGIVNVTPDSFFEGARSATPERAVEDGMALVESGFDLLDVGAVAARSGPPVAAREEAARLLPAVSALVERTEVPVLVDTFSPAVASQALRAGAAAVNDIGGGAREMLTLVAEQGCGYVLMHIEGAPREERPPPRYGDVVTHIRRWFEAKIEEALALGVSEEQIALDPGLDFDLRPEDNLEILRRLGELRDLGRPLYLALSRKDFLGAVLAGSWEERLPPAAREWATAAAAALAVAEGAEILRLHDRSALDAVRVSERIARA